MTSPEFAAALLLVRLVPFNIVAETLGHRTADQVAGPAGRGADQHLHRAGWIAVLVGPGAGAGLDATAGGQEEAGGGGRREAGVEAITPEGGAGSHGNSLLSYESGFGRTAGVAAVTGKDRDQYRYLSNTNPASIDTYGACRLRWPSGPDDPAALSRQTQKLDRGPAGSRQPPSAPHTRGGVLGGPLPDAHPPSTRRPCTPGGCRAAQPARCT